MGYCAKADILERISSDELARLTDDANGTTVDDNLVSRAIADADAEIDVHLAVRHSLPLPSTPTVLLKLSTELAIYHLYSRRMGAPDFWRTRYEDGLKMLKLIAAGKISLGLRTGAEPNGGDAVEITGNERQFTREKLEGF